MPDDPPISPRRPHGFDPKILARSVIAIPLLEQIELERRVIEEFKKKHPELLKDHNAALYYREGFPGGPRAAFNRALALLEEAKKEAGADSGQSIDPPLKGVEKNISPAKLDGRVIRLLLALDRDAEVQAIEAIWPRRHEVIIDINLGFKPRERVLAELRTLTNTPVSPDTRLIAQRLISQYIEEAKTLAEAPDEDQKVEEVTTELSAQYVFATLEGEVIRQLVLLDQKKAEEMAKRELTEGAELADAAKLDIARLRTIYRVWPDFPVRPCIVRSLATVKADAAQRSFSALGAGITWAVIDTGIQGDHPHFKKHTNVDTASTYHQDFTGVPGAGPATALTDPRGHGTHVAGIIAGEQVRMDATPENDMQAVVQELGDDAKGTFKVKALDAICGMAPKCKLVSLKVLDKFGDGNASKVIAAIAHIQTINAHGRELHIHGVNISIGYPFEAKWFACGHSPLCVEINRLVKSGVVVVVAAGNTGYGTLQTASGPSETCLGLTINDPGNAQEAITVGSTHRDEPHRYGVSYFSSKGPTGDGRLKPDLLAPGEKIISCSVPGSKLSQTDGDNRPCGYLETSGTSMAAPHVSGTIAAFLSIRQEFVGEAQQVKEIFTSTATDLGRDRNFQGSGLVDLMRAIQSI